MKIRVIVEHDEQANSFSAVCPELNYVASCGDTPSEAVDNLKEAILLMLEPIPKEHLFCSDKSVEFYELAV